MVDLRAWCASGMLALVACGPSAAADADADTVVPTSDTGNEDVAVETGAVDSTSGVETTGSADESSTGASLPGCAVPGACDESCVQWEVIVENRTDTWIEHVAVTRDGTILTIELRNGMSGDAILRGYDPAGAPVFEELLYEDADELIQYLAALEAGEDGTIAVLTVANVPGDPMHRTMLDVRMPDGTAWWSDVLGDDALSVSGDDVAFADDGTIVVVGSHDTGPVSPTGFATAYGPDQEVAWELVGSDLDIPYGSVAAVTRASASDFVLAGFNDHELWLGRIGLDGTVEWTMGERGDTELHHGAADVAMLSDGAILVVGVEGRGSGWPLPWLGRFGEDGSSQLSIAYPWIAPGPHQLDSIEVTDEGRIFVAGIRVNESGGTSRNAQEVDCEGTVAWEWVHLTPSDYDQANGGGLGWSPNVGLVVGGHDYLDKDQNYLQRGFLALLTP